MNWLTLLGISLAAIVTSYQGVVFLRGWAERRLLDIPNERSSHTQPTPRGGGLAIVAVTLAGGWLFSAFVNWEATTWQWIVYFLGAFLIAGISWLDDLRPLPNRLRFAVHVLGAGMGVLAWGIWQKIDVPGLGIFDLGWLGGLLTLLWIVGLTNAYNFMDGIDGLAGGQGIVAGLGWCMIGLISGNTLFGSLGLLLAASCLGFLCHNWPPARIFMGDVGSAFLGYTFAILPVIAGQSDPRSALIGILFVWPFVFDTCFTFFRRLGHRENVFAAHRSHLYQRLVIAGYSHRSVTMLYMGLAIVGLTLATTWSLRIEGSGVAIVLAMPALCLALYLFVTRRERLRSFVFRRGLFGTRS